MPRYCLSHQSLHRLSFSPNIFDVSQVRKKILKNIFVNIADTGSVITKQHGLESTIGRFDVSSIYEQVYMRIWYSGKNRHSLIKILTDHGHTSYIRYLAFHTPLPSGWSGGALALGNLPVPERPTIWMIVGQGFDIY